MIEFEDAYAIKATPGGVRCGNHHREDRTYHRDTENVRACYELTARLEADSAAEIAIEKGYERHLEDRGYEAARWDEIREMELTGTIW